MLSRPATYGTAMIRLVFRAARLERDPYLRMVVAHDGVADGLIIVAAVHAFLVVSAGIRGVDLISLVRFVLGGLFGWIILSGLVYLIGKHLLDGYGSFPGVMAAVSLAYPPLLVALGLELVMSPYGAQLVASVWLLACLWMAVRVSLELAKDRAVLAVLGGYLAWVVLRTIFFY
jgi:hypothetical protein